MCGRSARTCPVPGTSVRCSSWCRLPSATLPCFFTFTHTSRHKKNLYPPFCTLTSPCETILPQNPQPYSLRGLFPLSQTERVRCKSTFLLHELKTRSVLCIAQFETSEAFSCGQMMARTSRRNNKYSIIFGFAVP